MAGELEYSTTAGSNAAINGIAIQGTSSIQYGNDAIQQLMADQASALTRNVNKVAGTYTALKTDYNQLWRATGAVTINLTAAATLTDGWCLWVKADGGAVTIDPNGAETINGAATLTVGDGSSAFIVCTGTAFFAISIGDMTRTNPTFTGTINGGPLGDFRVKLINGDGRINQRTYTTVADDTYWCDRHYVLTQTAAIFPTILSNVANGLPSMMRLSQSQATAQRMGNAQIIEGIESRALRGKQVTLGGWMRCSSSQPIRFAVLEWTGTEDAVTSDVVNSWTNGTFTAGQFFIAANLTVAAVGTITPGASALTQWSLLANISSNCNNLIAFYWTEGTAAQSVVLDMMWGLVEGNATAESNPFSPRSIQQELALCQRFYEESTVYAVSYAASATFIQRMLASFKVPKRAVPTNAVTAVTGGLAPSIAASTVNIAWIGFTASAAGLDGSFLLKTDAEL